jgi:1-phosphofructokinase
MIYTVTFNPALDYVVHVDQLKTDAVNRSTGEAVFYGGKGINVSTVLHHLGIRSKALGFVAGFTGDEIEKGLKEQGMDTDFIHLKQGMSRINVKIKAEEETEINGQGPDISGEEIQALFQKLDELTEGDMLVLAGAIPSSIPSDIYETIMERLLKSGVSVTVDATKDLLLKVLKYHPFLIKPNNHELGEMFGVVCKTEEDIETYARKLQEQGAENVLVSLAGDGAFLLTKDGQTYRIGVPKGTVVNSVGAGDSMVAGFLASYLRDRDYEKALRFGTAAGSATAFSEGLAEKEEVERLYRSL